MNSYMQIIQVEILHRRNGKNIQKLSHDIVPISTVGNRLSWLT